MAKQKVEQSFSILKALYHKALTESLTQDDISCLTIHGKCNVINSLVGALRDKVPQKMHGSGRYVRDSLLIIAKSFEPSDRLLGLQYRKRNELFNAVSIPESAAALDVISNWNECSLTEQKSAVLHTTKLHQKIYLTGIADALPIEHVFTSNINSDHLSARKKLLGGFSGDMSERKCRIIQNTEDFNHPLKGVNEALHTAHHEVTHAVQFSLACAFHQGHIRPDHILYSDARIFHAVEVKRAVISFSVLKDTETQAYSEQMHERLAEDEGYLISRGLLDLAHS